MPDRASCPLQEPRRAGAGLETARRVAQQHGTPMRAEVALYIVHGILHTVGYDDKEHAARRAMRAAEREILTQLRLNVRDVDV